MEAFWWVYTFVELRRPRKGGFSMFKRKMRRVDTVCDKESDFYDCDGCAWEGIEVPKGDVQSAVTAFEQHDCKHYVHG
jgi:hypothetical protein